MRFSPLLRRPLCCLLLAPLALACAGIRVESDRDPAADLSAYRSYAWLEEPVREQPREPGSVPRDPFTHNSLLDGRMRAELDEQLQALGYERAPRDEADFWVRYSVVTRDEVEGTAGAVGGGYYGASHAYAGSVGYFGSSVYTYRQGTLLVDVIDPDSQRIVWRGWADRRSRGPHVDTDRLLAAVKYILAELPEEE